MRPQARYNKGEKIGNRYLVHQALMGGMGEVYLCLDLEERYPYALKTFQQPYLNQSQRLRQAFEQEVATWVGLEKHPNIVRCFYMNTLDNQPFMVLEWVAGEEGRGTDLRSWLRHGPLELKLALEITIDICWGLIHAQEKQPGLVHRDLKPENILMAQGGLAKVTDFGLAQIVQTAKLELVPVGLETDSRQTMAAGRGIVGTPAYMPPEQWRGQTLDVRTDIYAIGCILYEMLTGSWPFQIAFTPTTQQGWKWWLQTMQVKHEQDAVPSLATSFASELNDLLQRCLAKAPAGRPQSLKELFEQLTQLYRQQVGQEPPARPAPGVFTARDYNNRGNTYRALQQPQVALANYNWAIELDPNLADTYSNRGITYLALQQPQAALADCSRAIELNPNFAEAYVSRGNTYRALQQPQAAMADFNRAIELSPNFAPAYCNRGNTYLALQQPQAAVADYNRAIELDPNLAIAYYNRGLTYRDLQQPQAALADYSWAIELNPNYAKAYVSRGVAYTNLRQYQAALANFSRAIELSSNDANAYYNRGATYTNLQQPQAALADYSRAIELNPNDAQAYCNRGVAYADLRQPQAALADYNRAIELNPNDALAYSNRGNTYRALQQPQAALADYNRAIELNPNFALAYVNVGALLASHGQFQEALPYFEKAAQLGDPQGAHDAAQVRKTLGMESAPQANPSKQAFDAFQQADSLTVMRRVVVSHPILLQSDFITTIEQIAAQQVPLQYRSAFQQRLHWLQQIAKE